MSCLHFFYVLCWCAECQIAEMRNGSLLMTSRLNTKLWEPSPDNTTWPDPDRVNKRRAFARSDE